ncbi:MAG: SRPBCC family protein [Silvibacterium sp.]|nr:SRPBCC family protein [Silvibacterium sp.]
MKILLAVAGAVALLIVVVVFIGAMLPKSHTVSRMALYKATPQQLFALITGPQNWRPDLRSSEEFTDGGRSFIRETNRHSETITYELLHQNEPRSLERRIATENLPYSGSWLFSIEPSGSGTVVRITERGEVSNPVFRFVSRFILGQTRSLDDYLVGLGKAAGQEIKPRSA